MLSRHEVLGRLHEVLTPRGYLEIGVWVGESLRLSRTRTVAVDPVDRLTEPPPHADLHLVTATSDDFFADPDPMGHLPALDLAFVDGMHLVEFVLRDLTNLERHSHAGTVVLLDDVFPRNVEEAARERTTRDWTGDVFRIQEVLTRHRPDLTCVPLDTEPTGTMLVLGLDPTNTVLASRYEQIVAQAIGPDPQDVPPEIIARSGARDADRVLGSDFWPWLTRHRAELATQEGASAEVAQRARAALLGEAG